jgi:hypothetical protein
MGDSGLPLTTGEGNMGGYPASLIQDAEDVAVFAGRIKLRLPEGQHYLVDALATHAAECGRLREQLDATRQALARLASAEGFEGAGDISGDSFAERELRARGEFARAALGVEGPAE